jgi:GlpG protein
MAENYRALSVAIDEDLKPLAAVLARHGVSHRIFEEGGRQVVLVEHAEQAEQVRSLYDAWRAGEVRIELAPRATGISQGFDVRWSRAPVTLFLILLSIAGFAVVYLNAPMTWISYLTFNPFSLAGGEIRFHPVDGQYWRLVTPVFLHFGWLHIVFNCLWLWELGGRVEQVMGRVNMLMLFLVIAAVSNVSQFVFGGPGLFGGMSGVVYGLLGFSWVAPLVQPAWPIQPSRPIMLLMVGWLVVCMVGVVEVLGFGAIANAAHLGGLLCGAALGGIFGAWSRRGGDKPRVPPV